MVSVNRVINQFRRIYTDDGRHDVDFSERERLLQEARQKVVDATTYLLRASERLNTAALRAFPGVGKREH